MTKSVLFARTALALSMAGVPGLVLAQEATDTTATVESTAGTGDSTADIIVTAQRREQALIDVPLSISVVGEETLERQAARSFEDYAALVPGLTLTQENPGETRLILRGVNTGGVSSTVATYVDDTPFGASGALSNSAILAGDFDTFDVARVEVLRGPQGTLYGANALGGVLKFVTASPSTERFEVRGQAGIEDVAHGELGYNANAMVNVPISDTLAFRASGFYRTLGGYVDAAGRNAEDVNDSKSYGGRASLLFTPTDKLSVRLFGMMQNIETDSPSSFFVDPATLKPVNPITGAPVDESERTRFELIPEFNDLDYRLYSGTIDYDFDFATLTSITSYSEQTRDELGDVSTNEQFRGLANLLYALTAPGTVGAAFENDVEVEKFTQEVRLQSPSSDTFEWLVGGYYTKEDTGLIQELVPFTIATQEFIPPAITVPDFFGPPFGGNQIDHFVTSSIFAEYEEIAVFGSATIKFGENFDITAGGRYSHNEQSATTSLIQLGVGGPQTGESSEGVFTWSVSPRYEFNDHTSVYGRVAKGYRPGGPNFVPPGAGPEFPTQFNSDTIVSYELGFRTETVDRTVSLDGSVYYLDWDDVLILSTVDVAGTPVGVNSNGRRARSQGAELTVTARPTDGLSLVANMAYVDAELLDDTIPPGGGLNLSGGLAGDSLPYTPAISANLSVDYEWAIGSAEAFVGANLRLVGDQTAGFNADYRAAFGRRIQIDGYETVDLRAGVNFGQFSLQGYVKNLFDTYGVVSATEFPNVVGPAVGGQGIPLMNASTIRPRTVGLTFGADF